MPITERYLMSVHPLEVEEGGTYRVPSSELGRLVLGRFGTKLKTYLRQGYTLEITKEEVGDGWDEETNDDCKH